MTELTPMIAYNPVSLTFGVSDWNKAETQAQALETMEGAIGWWVGDFLNIVEGQYGEKYAQLVPEGKEETWRNYKWVASRFKPSVRRLTTDGMPAISWSHYQVLAGIKDDKVVEALLDAVQENKLSVSKLKAMLPGRKTAALNEHVCPNCGYKL
jgi:hypothetical protein